jgi:Ras-related protein Rab-1A
MSNLKTPSPEQDYYIKLLLLGDTGVGKSSLLHRYADGEFKQNLIGTAGVDHKLKNIEHLQKSIRI